MNNIIKSTLALGLVVAVEFLLTSPAEAETHTRSKKLVVMEARDLPEQAQTPGNSFERAIALNPNFAMAYYGLSIAFNNAGDTDHAN